MIGWIDGQAGASGDMLLGALVGAGVDLGVLQGAVDRLGVGVELTCTDVTRGGLAATQVHVHLPATTTPRRLPDVLAVLDRLPGPLRDAAGAVFARVAAAEASVHRVPVDDVHFHEVGALDAIADVVGAVAGFGELRLDALHCSTLAVGHGSAVASHGPLPVPAPAVLELLRGAPVRSGPARFEATTPTGAAILATLVTAWGPMPEMRVERVGVGAGSKEPTEVVNALRLVVGEPVAAGEPAQPWRGHGAAAV